MTAVSGSFGRFAHASQMMSYTGLVPSEHSSGKKNRRGAITKSGNSHLRRVLVESARCIGVQRRAPEGGRTGPTAETVRADALLARWCQLLNVVDLGQVTVEGSEREMTSLSGDFENEAVREAERGTFGEQL